MSQAAVNRTRRGGIAPLAVALLGSLTWSSADAAQRVDVRVVSSRPDDASGDDVLVEVNVPKQSQWSARLNGRDVTQSFHTQEKSGRPLALLTGLIRGKNALEIRVNQTVRSRLEILDYPLAGPIFSGPHQQPFICQTEANLLGPPLDADCAAKTVVEYYYKSTQPAPVSLADVLAGMLGEQPGSLAPGFRKYDMSGVPPSDVAQTTTSEGRSVPFIVRREIGTINRAVYDIRFLHLPGQPLPTPWTAPTAGWNGRLVYNFGGGCGSGYHQGTLVTIGMLLEPLLAQGYAVATSTFNIFLNGCNDRIAAETLSMVKEHFIKTVGEPIHTIGWGISGGSEQQHLIAQNYPGLLDGIMPGASFPDQLSGAHDSSVTDCPLLDHAFKSSKQDWTEEQKSAVAGFASWRTCLSRLAGGLRFQPRSCDRSIPKSMIYDAISNPKGLRCDIYDGEINVLGHDVKTGFAGRLIDNVGIQYGLLAFNSRKIDAERFIDLNEQIGGYDSDGKIIPARTSADLASLQFAYQRGLVLTGGGGLGQVPIIDWRQYSDDLADVHARFESFVTRARMVAANGSADNQVILVSPRSNTLTDLLIPPAPTVQWQVDLVREMDRWLDNVVNDTSAGTLAEKIVRDKPAGLSDGCWAIDGERIVEHATYSEPGRCNNMYPSYRDPQLAAGAPLTDDVLKCALKPIARSDYSQPLNTDQWQRLRAAFPTGVCDYSAPGVGHAVTQTTWQRF